MSRLKEVYFKKIQPELKKTLGIENSYALPRLEKVVLNIGIGQAKGNPKFEENAQETLSAITGQRPAPRKAKKAISGFKIRQGEKIGLMVTLRGDKMYDFIDRLINITLPRMRDFRGIDVKNFDNKGNLTLGISEQIIFPEITHEKAEIIHGLSITIVTTAKNTDEAKALMKELGFPIKGEIVIKKEGK